MKVLQKIFNPEKLGEAVISGVDKAFFTNEEKTEKFAEFLKLYEPYKLAQRVLSIMFSGVFLLVHLIITLAHFTFILLEKDATNIIELYDYNNQSLGTLVLIIVSFYFAGGVLEGTIKKFKK